jgi:hypothetical protein
VAELRIDVEARNARQQFEAAARGVSRLADELTDAEINAVRLERAVDEAADEVDRLEREIRSVDAAFGDSSALRTRLQEARVAAVQAQHAWSTSTQEVRRFERALNDAEREADRLRIRMDDLDRDTRRSTTRMRRGLLSFATSLRSSGSSAAMMFASGFGRTFGAILPRSVGSAFSGLPPQAQAGIAAAAVTVAVMFSSVLAAVLNGLLLTAVSGGALALGIAVAVRDSRVQAAFRDLGTEVMDDMTRIAQYFVRPLIESASMFTAAWRSMRGGVSDAMTSLAGTIKPLAAGVIGMFREMGPGLKQALGVGVTLLKEMAALLPGLGRSIGKAFDMLSRPAAAEGALKGLRIAFALLGFMIEQTANAIAGLSAVFAAFTNGVGRGLEILSKIPGLGAAFRPLADAFAKFNSEGRTMPGTAQAASTGLGQVAEAARRASAAAAQFNNEIQKIFGMKMGMDEALLGWEAAFDALTESIKQNGVTLDIATEKGRANTQAVLAGVQAAEQKRQAAIDLAGGENASAEAVAAANAAFLAQIDQLGALMRSLGFTQSQIDGLLGKYRDLANAPNITKTVTVNYRVNGAGQAVVTGGGGSGGGGGRDWVMNRFGGLYAARGLMNLSGTAALFRAGVTPTYGFAERGTGGEAFIARNAPRRRSLAIAAQAAAWHGGTVVPNDAMGGGGGGGTPLYVAPGGDRMVADFLTKLIRTGVLRLA